MGIRNLASVCSSGAPVCFVRDRGVDGGGGGAADARTRTPRPAGARCPSTSCSPPAAARSVTLCIIQVCTYVCMYDPQMPRVTSPAAAVLGTKPLTPTEKPATYNYICTVFRRERPMSRVQLTRSYRYHPNKRINYNTTRSGCEEIFADEKLPPSPQKL